MGAIEIRISGKGPDIEQSEAIDVMDADLDVFSKYLESLPSPGGGPLTRPERAVLKTYLVAKLRGKI